MGLFSARILPFDLDASRYEAELAVDLGQSGTESGRRCLKEANTNLTSSKSLL
jgi:hypothetical protein